MHRVVQDYLEEVLANSTANNPGTAHLASCEGCREEVALLQDQAALLRQLKYRGDAEPRGGFYARVMDRIDVQRASIWSLFFDSVFARRIAFASLSLAVLLGGYVVSSERIASQEASVAQTAFAPSELNESGLTQVEFGQYDQPGVVLNASPDQDAVLANLVTYRER